MLVPLSPQCAQFGQPALVAGAPGGDAVAQPILFHRDLAAELVLLTVFLIEDGVAPGFKSGEPLVQGAGDAAVEPDRRAREPLQQPSVVADQHDSGAHRGQLALQPFDARQVEMVGRLVEQQDVGKRRQRPGERGAARLAAGQRDRIFVAAKTKLLQQVERPVAIGRLDPEPRLDISEGGGEPAQIRLLRQIADPRAGLDKALAGIRLDETGGDPQQCRLAGAVAPDEAYPVAGGDGQLRARQERHRPECQARVPQQEQRRGHGFTASARPSGGGEPRTKAENAVHGHRRFPQPTAVRKMRR